MNIGLVGAGRIGKFHAQTLATDQRVDELRINDIDPARAESLASATKGVGAPVGTMSDPDALADWADALVIASSTDSHAEMIYLGAEKRIPTFCEKPISLNLSITDPVLDAVETSGIQLQIGFQRRFDEGLIEIQRLVQTGSLGRIYAARLGTHDPEPPPAGYLAVSGGIFADMLIHDFDLLRWATGQDIAQLYATGGALTGDPMFEAANDIDTAAIIATLEDGAISVITGLRHNPLGYDVRLEVFGSKDSVASGIDEQSPLRLIGFGDSDEASEPGKRPMHGDFISRFGEAYRAELRAFIGVAINGTQVAASGEDAREALRAAAAAHLSFTERRPVDMTEIT